jgi:hypothetical protein
MAREVSPRKLEPKLEEAVQNQPLLEKLLSFNVLGKAVAVGPVVALILFVLLSPVLAGIGLLLAFFVSWYAFAATAADRVRPVDSERDDDAPSSDSE